MSSLLCWPSVRRSLVGRDDTSSRASVSSARERFKAATCAQSLPPRGVLRASSSCRLVVNYFYETSTVAMAYLRFHEYFPSEPG